MDNNYFNNWHGKINITKKQEKIKKHVSAYLHLLYSVILDG